MALPKIIQGGMGVAISTWQLANTVSKAGQLGVVSGTGIALIMMARLSQGDEGGHIRRALSNFPLPEIAEWIIEQYYVPDGLPEGTPFQRPPMWTINPSIELNQLTVVANFVEVWLAKEGHDNPVGINLLEKVQLPNLASIYGAMLAGVDYVIMGAGIPMQIPEVLDELANHQPVSYRLEVQDADEHEEVAIIFDPLSVFPNIHEQVGKLTRPQFLPVVSSVVLALALKNRAKGAVNGFVIEMPTAGGHNAPPRGKLNLNDDGEPIYGPKDEVKLKKFRDMGLPFWLAGGYGNREKLEEALAEGASGIQVGTAFAFCDESGLDVSLREPIIQQVLSGDIHVHTSSRVSPTGFPFKVVQLEGTASDTAIYEERPRLCDVGYLRHLYKDKEGNIGYRCPAEPIKAYLRKGGKLEDTEGRQCLCNHLGAAAGYAQNRRSGYVESPIVTSGDDLVHLAQFIPEGQTSYSANDVLNEILAPVETIEGEE